jgi:NADH:ubiquinone oxidoreductase subunit F (NADH-binding)
VGPVNCSGTKLYCLSGKLNRTGLVELPMGATLGDLINVYGKGIRGNKKFKFAQVGGTAGGIVGSDLMDLPLDIDQPVKEGRTLGSGAVLVCDEGTCPVDFLLHVLSFFKHESCGQCVPCRVGTAQLFSLIQKFAARTADISDIDLMVNKAEFMKKSSLCALGQSPVMPIVTMLNYYRNDFEKHCDPNYSCECCDESLRVYYTGNTH